MSGNLFAHAVLGLLPVCCFLAALQYLDSYKLVSMRGILTVIALGGVTAALSYLIHTTVLGAIDISFAAYTRYASPLIEESLKATIVIVLIRYNRIGFLVDAAILGFAVGAGFAMI